MPWIGKGNFYLSVGMAKYAKTMTNASMRDYYEMSIPQSKSNSHAITEANSNVHTQYIPELRAG